MKISTKIIRQFKKNNINKVINLSDFTSVKERLLDIENNLKKNFDKFDYDPSHKIYILTQNWLSLFAEEFSTSKEFNEYYDKAVEIEDDFMPSGPPMSPLTGTYFTFWCFCDLRFGKEMETVGTIFYDLAVENEFDEIIKKAISNLNLSYMGFYVHIGFEDNLILLREIITNKEYRCICPTGYKGKKGEILFVRIVPNLDGIYNYHIIINTPYIILNYSEKDWINFFLRQSIKKDDINYTEKLYNFLKYHPDFKYWHNYVMDAYVNYSFSHIFLTGIPDIKGSKPHEL